MNRTDPSRPIEVLVFVPALPDTGPGQRFRIEQWMPALSQAGFRFTYVPFESPELHRIIYARGRYGRKAWQVVRGLLNRLRWLCSVRRFDLVFVYREAALAGPAVIERIIKWLGVPVVFDFDDAIFLRDVSEANRPFAFLKCPGKTAAICRLSAHVIVGNAYLRDYAAQWTQRVSVIPTTIDTSVYQPKPNGTGHDAVVIGWSGSVTTVKHLLSIKEALGRLQERHRIVFRAMGAPPSAFNGLNVEVEAKPWNRATEVQDIQGFDVGLMPLTDDPWAKGKCGLKALQYMAVGVPVVCSPVGVNTDIVSHGVNGFLATHPDEWVAHLSRLVFDADLRRQLGQAGRRTVEERYSTQRYLPQLLEIFREAAGR